VLGLPFALEYHLHLQLSNSIPTFGGLLLPSAWHFYVSRCTLQCISHALPLTRTFTFAFALSLPPPGYTFFFAVVAFTLHFLLVTFRFASVTLQFTAHVDDFTVQFRNQFPRATLTTQKLS
jgi:hypothetical protein